jgi:hypothetical protein
MAREAEKMFINTKSIQDLIIQLNEQLKHLEARLQRIETLLAYQRELTKAQTGVILGHLVNGWIHIGYTWSAKISKQLKEKLLKRGVSAPQPQDRSLNTQ